MAQSAEDLELTCPRCGDAITGIEVALPGRIGESEGEEIRINVDCTDCGAPVSLIMEPMEHEVADYEIWVEDRRDE